MFEVSDGAFLQQGVHRPGVGCAQTGLPAAEMCEGLFSRLQQAPALHQGADMRAPCQRQYCRQRGGAVDVQEGKAGGRCWQQYGRSRCSPRLVLARLCVQLHDRYTSDLERLVRAS